jgi:hypothetical protein
LNIRRKGAAIAFTATLLSTMIATIAAPLASASVAVSSAGTVPRGGTSTTAASFTLRENTAAGFGVVCPYGANGGAISIQIRDSAGGSTVHFVGPVGLSAPGSLNASAVLDTTVTANDTLTVLFNGAGAHDDLNIEQVVASAKISADNGAPNGAIKAQFINPAANHPGYTDQGACVASIPSTVTASGKLAVAYAPGTTAITLVLDAGSCPFAPTAGAVGSAVFGGTNPETKAVTAAGAPAGGVQTITVAPLTLPKSASDPVTQAGVPNCTPYATPFAISSPGTVGSSLTQTAGTPTVVNVGENNQPTADTTLKESPTAASGTLTGTVTFTIATPGVVFSSSPTVVLSANLTGPTVCTISVDRKSCTVTVTNSEPAATTGTESVRLTGILVDVAANATPGAPVTIAATNGSTPINTTSATVAFIGRVIIGVAAQPTVFIGFNDQQSGMKTLTESGPGFFQTGAGSNNTFGLCIYTGETFTRAPWAVVTNAGGTGAAGLQLLNPATATGVSQIQGTLTNGGKCAYWTIFSASTTGPATIEIRGSDAATPTAPLASGATNGPRLSVPNGLAPGSEQAAILVGTAAAVIPGCTSFAGCSANAAFASVVSEAIRAFKNSVSVTAASQPNCPPGTTDCLLGNIVITETQNGQFKPGDVVRGYFVPDSKSARNDVLIKAGNTNDQPIITTNTTSGLLVSPVTIICPPNVPLLNICFFQFTITQQSFGPALGQVTVSNIHATIAKDATPGPILMDWGNTGIILGVPLGAPAGQPFETVVTNGTIGAGPNPPATTKTSATSAIGKTISATAFSVGTKVVTLVPSSNNVVTIRIKVDPALVGKNVTIQRAVKNSAGVWSAFTNLTSRTVGADGYAYYYASAHSAQWLSFRGAWLGNAQFAPSHSQTVQVRWV